MEVTRRTAIQGISAAVLIPALAPRQPSTEQRRLLTIVSPTVTGAEWVRGYNDNG